MEKINREYKDTMFRLIFKDKENLLSLYNAVNRTAYTNADDLEINTLENAVYMTYKNDISFVMDFQLYLYEHQSTINPNMPLRNLFYVTKILQGITSDMNLYSPSLKKIPTPNFIVFYNGKDDLPECSIQYLSTAFTVPAEEPKLELKVTVLNINHGNNSELMEACRKLKDYAQYVAILREHAKQMSMKDAVELTITECIQKDILADFLRKNRAEVLNVCLYEFDQEKYMAEEREIAEEKGIRIGQERGEKIGQERGEKIGQERGEKIGQEIKLISLIQKKVLRGKSLEKIANDLEEDISEIESIYIFVKDHPDKSSDEILKMMHR